MKHPAVRPARGFTLLELMMVIVVAGILLGLGVPSFTNFIRNARMTQAANDVVAALQLARTEAIKRRAAVTLCTATDLDAAPTCSGAADLAGWIVFVDNNRNGQWDAAWTFNDVDGDGNQDVAEDDGPDADTVWTANQPDEDIDDDGNRDVEEADVPEDILQVHAPLHESISSRGSIDPLTITYLDTGFTSGAVGALALCDSRGNVPSAGELSAARIVVLSATGRASVTRDRTEIETALGVIRDATGDDSAIGGCQP